MGWTSLQEDIAARHDDLGHMIRKFDRNPVGQRDAELTNVLAACRRLLDQITRIAKTAATPADEIALRLVSAEGRVVDLQLQLERARQTTVVTKRQLVAERERNDQRDAPLREEINELRRRLEKSKLTSAGKAARLKSEVAAARRATHLIQGTMPEVKHRSKSKRKIHTTRVVPKLGGKSVEKNKIPLPKSRSLKAPNNALIGAEPKTSS